MAGRRHTLAASATHYPSGEPIMRASRNIERTRNAAHGLLAIAAIGLAATPVLANPLADLQANDSSAGVTATVTGGGVYRIGFDLDVKFSMNAIQRNDGWDNGNFRHETTFQGLLVSFAGSVTCVAVDADNGRAWIGGVITRNRSEHPAFTGAIHQPGRDIWFRVLDGSQAEPDRTTFVGFEGGAGIITSEEYCELRIWPDDNERTSPVIEGNISVRP
jgi:hypothetical protein